VDGEREGPRPREGRRGRGGRRGGVDCHAFAIGRARARLKPGVRSKAQANEEETMTDVKAGALGEVLGKAGIGFDVLDHDRTETAVLEAAALGLRPSEVAKTVVVRAPEGDVRVVISSGDRIDMHRLRELLDGGSDVRLATEDELASDYPEFELGAVPPVGGKQDAVLVDRRVAERETVVLEAGVHDQSIRIDVADLVRVTGARVVDVVEG
jgi:Ala-tRNA(Pro) deacylase